ARLKTALERPLVDILLSSPVKTIHPAFICTGLNTHSMHKTPLLKKRHSENHLKFDSQREYRENIVWSNESKVELLISFYPPC
uniref:Uncharacterized protein n=1 Tax=Xiphophorus couchianus TaxID=32473 RepID=A0A3B5L5V6_9TELE